MPTDSITAWYITPEPSPGGSYGSPQSPGFPGAVGITDEQMRFLVSYNGFVNITVENDIVTEMMPNLEAWEAWKASLPEPAEEPEPAPTPEERIASLEAENRRKDAQIAVQAEQLTYLEDCLLELGDVVYA